MRTEGMLAGLRVIDITNNLAGPAAAGFLADYGADVIHVEKPRLGDDCRNFMPLIDGVGASHFTVNKNKRSLVLDLKDPKAIEILYALLKDTDVLIESNRPGVMDRLGLGYEDVRKIRPDIVYCSVSAFGQTGPYAGKAGYDIIAQAYSGMMYYTGEPDGGPVKCCTAIGDFVGALNAYGSLMTALYYRQATGVGQHVDIALARGLLWANATFDYKYTGKHRRRMGNHDGSLCPYGVFRGRNGQSAVIGAVNVNLWKKLCAAMGRPELADDPRYETNSARVVNQGEVIALIEDWLAGFADIREALRLLDDAGVPCTKVYSMEDLAEDEHALACGWIGEVPVPDGVTSITGRLSPIGVADFSAAEARLEKAPALGQHNREILASLGMDDAEIELYNKKWGLA